MNTGEAVNGKKIHAVAEDARDGSWTKALCGAEVIVYRSVPFLSNSEWSQCKRCKNKLDTATTA